MSGDISRKRFDPHHAFSGVQLQQGRVSLDADFNELEEILDRRDRAETYDTVGPAVYPATSPNGFHLQIDPSTEEITIGPGRAYVDGILAECFGNLEAPKGRTFDAHLEQDVSTAPLPLPKQPFRFGTGFPGPSTTSGAVDIAYLDVFRRDVTVLEEPNLREPALGGPDTTTRVQTAWQVKFLNVDPSTTCTEEPQAWKDLIAPSTARLTNSTVPVVAAPAPCVVDPVAGYTGLENRLYRVEVHRAGTLGGATEASFVWSRDNASLTAGVLKIVATATGSVLTVSSTGRDTWTRFEKNQVLELLDDDIEYGRRDRGTGGPLLTITEVVHSATEIHVKEDLTTYLTAQGANPRLLRWDTDPKVSGMATERKIQPGVALRLEEGIQVTFVGGATDTVHVGDYWVFAARTADGTIEVLTAQAPRGIHHHYMRLGMVTAGSPATVECCRVKWPPDCDCEGGCECDQCVTPESHASGDLTIQDALDAVVAAGGGAVCLEHGQYVLDTGLVLTRGMSVRLRGKGYGTQIWFRGDGPALAVSESIDVEVRDLTIVTERGRVPFDGYHAIEVSGCARITLDDLYVFEDLFALLTALDKGRAPRPHGAAIACAGLVVDLDVERCVLAAGYGVAAPATINLDHKGGVLLGRFGVRDSWIFATRTGIRLGDAEPTSLPAMSFDQVTLTGNSIYGCTDHGIVLALLQVAGAARVAHNVIASRGTGLWVSTDGARVEDNTVTSLTGDALAHGIVLAGQDKAQLSRVSVGGNEIRVRDVGILLDGEVGHVTIDHNRLRSCGNGILMSLESGADNLRVTENWVVDVVPPERSPLVAGICLVRASNAVIADNLVRGVGLQKEAVGSSYGILTLVCPHVRVSGNTVQDIGFERPEREASGIASAGAFRDLDVLHNTVHQHLGRGGSPMIWFALEIGRVSLKDAFGTHALIGPEQGFWLGLTSVSTLAPDGRRMLAGVSGNTFATDGISPSTTVAGPISCLVSDNRVVHEANPVTVMQFQVATLAFTSNHVESAQFGPKQAVAVEADVDIIGAGVPAFTAVGNFTAGNIVLNGSPLPPPWDTLNVELT